MTLHLPDLEVIGPALPSPFLRHEIEHALKKERLLPPATGPEAEKLERHWELLQRKLRLLGDRGGPARVANHVLAMLVGPLGYDGLHRAEPVTTREGEEDGGYLLSTSGAHLRAWSVEVGADLEAPTRRGHAYRFSPLRVAQRVLREKGERIGLLTDGIELRVLLTDPARPESQLVIKLDRNGGWRGYRTLPDSLRLLIALGSPRGLAALPSLLELARLAQTLVTKKLREQAKRAVLDFVQELYDDPRNASHFRGHGAALPKRLWAEALLFVYRLLFILKLESSHDLGAAFSFSSHPIWRGTFSPSTTLARYARLVLDDGAETGELLAGGLRALFRLFQEGLHATELEVTPLGGMLFGPDAAPLLERAAWSERAAARLLDALLWTPKGRDERERVHYGSLDVEDLGRVYEALLELDAGLAMEPMCRLRRMKLEVVLPAAQGERYRKSAASASDDDEDEDDDDNEKPAKGSRVVFVEDIPAGRFYVRAGLGRKATGSYYTPHAFVKFLVQETLGPMVQAAGGADPRPAAILELNVLDPAMGSGHFLVEACRFLGLALYDACAACDLLAADAERGAEAAKTEAERERLRARARELRQRVEDLPDPNDELLRYLPSRVPEGQESGGLSHAKALAISRRLVAVHCLYGVDKNPLAVELAKVSLWLESYAEGLPLTFLDHRLVEGDSLTGPFFEKLLTFPGSGESVVELQSQGLGDALKRALGRALGHVRDLEASVGKDLAEVKQKEDAKAALDAALRPFLALAEVWTGGVMLGAGGGADDGGYGELAMVVAAGGDVDAVIAGRPGLVRMREVGRGCVPYDLRFPEVFYPGGKVGERRGFDVVLGNPPWDAIKFNTKEFLASYDPRIVDSTTKLEREQVERALLQDDAVRFQFEAYQQRFEHEKRTNDRLYEYQKVMLDGDLAGRQLDAFRVFLERASHLVRAEGLVGQVVPSSFHAAAGCTGIRRLYLERMTLRVCFSFENRCKLFEIDSRFKFAVVVARKSPPSAHDRLECAFYLHDLAWLSTGEPLLYDVAFVRRTGGDAATLLELRGPSDQAVAEVMFDHATLGPLLRAREVGLGAEVHMTNDAFRFTARPTITPDDPREPPAALATRALGYLPLHEGKTFHQYTDRWDAPPRYLVALATVADKPGWLAASRHYRLAFRDVASSTNERTGIFCLLPPGVLCGNTAPCERQPQSRPHQAALVLLAVANAYAFDWTLRLKSAAHVNLFILDGCPVPPPCFEDPRARFLAHGALRLSANHTGFAPLWDEQLGGAYREPAGGARRFPILEGDAARWGLRAQLDAVVAEAYGLTRAHYEHVLSGFNHKSFPAAPALCLAAFDELATIGLAAYLKSHDPYHDLALPTALPTPVLTYEGALTGAEPGRQTTLFGDAPARRGGRRRR